MPSIEKTSVESPIIHDQVTVGLTAVQLTDQPSAVRGLLVKALDGNAGTVYIGTSKVSASNGFPLEAGASVELEVSNPSTIYAIASAIDQGVAWILL